MKALFIDKDGTLLENVPYNTDPARMRFVPGADFALRRLQRQGYRLFVISNQSGVARGHIEDRDLQGLKKNLREMVGREGIELSGIYFCPHDPEGVVPHYSVDCDCRKPKPGMILQGYHEHGLDLSRSWMIGDILNDVEAGNRAGCRSILLDTGGETEWRSSDIREPMLHARSWGEVVDFILTTETLLDPEVRAP